MAAARRTGPGSADPPGRAAGRGICRRERVRGAPAAGSGSRGAGVWGAAADAPRRPFRRRPLKPLQAGSPSVRPPKGGERGLRQSPLAACGRRGCPGRLPRGGGRFQSAWGCGSAPGRPPRTHSSQPRLSLPPRAATGRSQDPGKPCPLRTARGPPHSLRPALLSVLALQLEVLLLAGGGGALSSCLSAISALALCPPPPPRATGGISSACLGAGGGGGGGCSGPLPSLLTVMPGAATLVHSQPLPLGGASWPSSLHQACFSGADMQGDGLVLQPHKSPLFHFP